MQDRSDGLTLFALNRHLTEPMPLTVTMSGIDPNTIKAARTLHHADLDAANTRDSPDTVRPGPLEGASLAGGTLRAVLPPGSWNVLRLG